MKPEERILLKLGVDTRHKRACDDFSTSWSNAINLAPRRVIDENRILAKDKITAEYWLVWKDCHNVNGYQISYAQASEYISEAKRNLPAYAARFKNPDLYTAT